MTTPTLRPREILRNVQTASVRRAVRLYGSLRWPEWLSGSAAAGIAQRLHQARANVIGPGVSFFVSGKLPVLEPGEVERAAAWAASLAARLESIPVTRPVKA
jgi:hypothetical protein